MKNRRISTIFIKKNFALFLIFIIIIIWSLNLNNNSVEKIKIKNIKIENYGAIKCHLSNQKGITCLKWLDKLFVPLDFISKKFDVSYFLKSLISKII